MGGVSLLQTVYPIGSVYISVNSINPSVLFNFGEWEQIKDTFLLGAGENYSAGSMGGASTITLTESNLPAQNGKITMHGGDQATNILSCEGVFREWNVQEGRYRDAGMNIDHPTQSVGVIYYTNNGQNVPVNNMPPYLTVYMWKRVK